MYTCCDKVIDPRHLSGLKPESVDCLSSNSLVSCECFWKAATDDDVTSWLSKSSAINWEPWGYKSNIAGLTTMYNID